jgi:hypothetical protein
MWRETYHLIAVHEPPPDDTGAGWLHACLVNARAAFLQQLGLTSARLRTEGLRLALQPEGDELPSPPPITEAAGITLELQSAGEAFAFEEAIYDTGHHWVPLWRGTTQVWAEAAGEVRELPDDLIAELDAWLNLSRGSIAVAERPDDSTAC